MPLTQDQVAVIKATIPVLQQGGVGLTTQFYKNMIGDHPELKAVFNMSHQATGTQPRALAHSLLLYATHIDDLSKLTALVERITEKHVVLNIPVEGYEIVGKYLIATMKEVLGDVATPAIIEAWTAAYKDLAALLIDIEEKLYQKGQWRGYREFTISKKIEESKDVVSLILTPVDGKPVKPGKPGQYIGIKINDAEKFATNGGSIRREYTVSDTCDGKSFRISVKRVPNGVASNYIHDVLKAGDKVEIAPPIGNFIITEPAALKKAVFIAGGIGITPLIPISKQIVSAIPNASATLAYSTHSVSNHPFAQELAHIAENSNGRFNIVNYFSKDTTAQQPNKVGRIQLADVKALLPTNAAELKDTHVFYLGPIDFMTDVSKYLEEVGVPKENTHREFFMPDQSLVVP